MPKYQFQRDCRTASSETFNIYAGEERPMGRIDLHFGPIVVHGTLCVNESLTQDEVQELIDVIDDELVLPSDMPRDDFIVVVYQGREVGTFSDQDVEEGAEGELKW